MDERYNNLKDLLKRNNLDLNDPYFQAESVKNFDEKYRDTREYNGYHVREKAEEDAKKITAPYLARFEGATEVKTKEVQKDKLQRLKDKAILALSLAAVAAATIVVVDLAVNPELYVTTDPNYAGPTTFIEMIKRFPENAKEIVEAIAGAISKIGGR